MPNLNAKAWIANAVLGVIMGLLLFVSAGTVRYWQAWTYLVIFFAGAALTTAYLMRHDPALLERRMRGGPTGENRPAQRIIMVFTSISFMALLIVPGLDYRFGWSHVPFWVVLVGDVLVVIGFYLIFIVYKTNTFASATVQVAADQTVISTGPYAIVRHPMYASALFFLGGTPLALGSYGGFAALALMFPFLIWRLLDEEALLAQQLRGYTEYQQKVRYRLVPRIW